MAYVQKGEEFPKKIRRVKEYFFRVHFAWMANPSPSFYSFLWRLDCLKNHNSACSMRFKVSPLAQYIKLEFIVLNYLQPSVGMGRSFIHYIHSAKGSQFLIIWGWGGDLLKGHSTVA